MMVAWEPAVPGTPSRTDEIVSEVEVMAYMPMSSAIASYG